MIYNNTMAELEPGRYAAIGGRLVRQGNAPRIRLYRGMSIPPGALAEFKSENNAYMYVSTNPLIALGYANNEFGDDDDEGQLYVFDADPKTYLKTPDDRPAYHSDDIVKLAKEAGIDVIEGDVGALGGEEAVIRDPGMLDVKAVYRVDDDERLSPIIPPNDPEIDAMIRGLPAREQKDIALRRIESAVTEYDRELKGFVPSQDKARRSTDELQEVVDLYQRYQGRYESDPKLIRHAMQQIKSNKARESSRRGRGRLR